ncbi:unnamed protein product [Cochlearia groenlandica]
MGSKQMPHLGCLEHGSACLCLNNFQKEYELALSYIAIEITAHMFDKSQKHIVYYYLPLFMLLKRPRYWLQPSSGGLVWPTQGHACHVEKEETVAFGESLYWFVVKGLASLVVSMKAMLVKLQETFGYYYP